METSEQPTALNPDNLEGLAAEQVVFEIPNDWLWEVYSPFSYSSKPIRRNGEALYQLRGDSFGHEFRLLLTQKELAALQHCIGEFFQKQASERGLDGC